MESRYAASSRSLTVSAEQSICSSGTLMPLRDLSFPPMTTSTDTHVGLRRSLTFTSMKPSSSRSCMPSVTPLISAVCSVVGVRVMRPGLVRSASLSARPNSSTSPAARGTGASSTVIEQRNLGPWMSPRILTSRPAAAAVSRMFGMSASNCPGTRCDEFSRKTSTPAAMSFLIISGEMDAGPRVATILPLRAKKSTSTAAKSEFSVPRLAAVCFLANSDVPPTAAGVAVTAIAGALSRVASPPCMRMNPVSPFM
mmetsp:Transcript_30973/g.62052  ORF Transcript_30973/g.62052 Transcript_30973/m.62052 type:complete len:254 (-) Transcript_30973:33-794(-)